MAQSSCPTAELFYLNSPILPFDFGATGGAESAKVEKVGEKRLLWALASPTFMRVVLGSGQGFETAAQKR
jgi:hypothetical protein